MKHIFIVFALNIACSLTSFGQGQVLFSNSETSTVRLASTGELLGPGWRAQLWAGKTAGELLPAGEYVEFLGGGRFIGSTVTIEGIAGEETAFLKVGAWQAPAVTLEEAQEMGLPWGFSNTFSQLLGGPSGDGPPLVPALLEGLQAFEVGSLEVPQIGQWVWSDVNGNGIQDPEEMGLAGVQLDFLDCASGAVLASVISDDTGHYTYPGDLPAATYIQPVVPDGFTISPWLIGEDRALDNNIDPLTGASECIALDCEALADAICPGLHIDIGLIPLMPGEDPDGNPNPTIVAGVSGPGFWKRHLSAWPLENVTIGGKEYTQKEAIPFMSNGSDKSLTLFRQVLTAKLNLATGSNPDCIEAVLAEADAWLETYGPVPANIRGGSAEWQEGEPLADALEAYNAGRACAPVWDESLSPVEMAVGFQRGEDRPKGMRIRIKGQPGRVFVLQMSSDMIHWEDIGTVDNAFGISEVFAEVSEQYPSAVFRVVPESGPAKNKPGKRNRKGVFRQMNQGESAVLEPIVYEGDLVIAGSKNQVSGQTVDAEKYTVIAGNLDIRGNSNLVSDLTVLGDVILRGNGNELSNVDYQGEVIIKGKGDNDY